MLSDDQLKGMEVGAPLAVAEIRRLYALEGGILNMDVRKHVQAQKETIYALELQLHDDQTLRQDYESILKKHDEAMEAFKLMKAAAQRDEETIAELSLQLTKPPERSETFKEVRDERDECHKLLETAATDLAKHILENSVEDGYLVDLSDGIDAMLIKHGIRGLAK